MLRNSDAECIRFRLDALESDYKAFEECVRQVSRHCAERGEVLERLRGFYSNCGQALLALCKREQIDAVLGVDTRISSEDYASLIDSVERELAFLGERE